jgi:hypothetical protein
MQCHTVVNRLTRHDTTVQNPTAMPTPNETLLQPQTWPPWCTSPAKSPAQPSPAKHALAGAADNEGQQTHGMQCMTTYSGHCQVAPMQPHRTCIAGAGVIHWGDNSTNTTCRAHTTAHHQQGVCGSMHAGCNTEPAKSWRSHSRVAATCTSADQLLTSPCSWHDADSHYMYIASVPYPGTSSVPTPWPPFSSVSAEVSALHTQMMQCWPSVSHKPLSSSTIAGLQVTVYACP